MHSNSKDIGRDEEISTFKRQKRGGPTYRIKSEAIKDFWENSSTLENSLPKAIRLSLRP